MLPISRSPPDAAPPACRTRPANPRQLDRLGVWQVEVDDVVDLALALAKTIRSLMHELQAAVLQRTLIELEKKRLAASAVMAGST